MLDFMRKCRQIARQNSVAFLRKYAFNTTPANQNWQDFYQRFEDKFRGSKETIEQRLKNRYARRLSDVLGKSNAFRQGLFVDLGCGRGEMLNLARTIGFKTLGVDASNAAVQYAKQMGHDALVTDGLSFLRSQPQESAVAISMLHVIEHIGPEYAWAVFKEAYRVLKPGGIFLVETPSLFSLWASQRQFYLDPTHVRPVHPEFMEFMAKDIGFSTAEIILFDEVESIDRAKLAESTSGKLVDQYKKLEKWLYGEMDVALWSVK